MWAQGPSRSPSARTLRAARGGGACTRTETPYGMLSGIVACLRSDWGTGATAMKTRRTLLVMAVALLVPACAVLGGRKSGAGVSAQGEDPFETIALEKHQEELRGIVEEDLRAARRRQGAGDTKVVFKKPYFYREYSVYPEASDGFTVHFTEKESRTTPLTADIKNLKTRYATRLRGKREEARADLSFLRSTGTETVSYELRSGRWRRAGTLYVAGRTEEFVEGEWREIEERPARMSGVEEEEESRWWNRLLFWR